MSSSTNLSACRDPNQEKPGQRSENCGITSQPSSSLIITPQLCVSGEFLTGCQLLRITRKKARTRTFSIDAETGALLLDGVNKFCVDSIRDVRVGADASHYRELCKISVEHEERWLSIIYYMEGLKFKVLNVICPSKELLDRFKTSLIRLHRQRSRYLGYGLSFCDSTGEVKTDEDTWHSVIPESRLEPTNLHPSLHATSSAQAPASRCLSFDEVELLCQKLQFHAPEQYLRSIFDKVDSKHTGQLDFSSFKEFVALLKRRHEVQEIYAKYKSADSEEMSRLEFFSFLYVQGLDDPNENLKVFKRSRNPTTPEKQEFISAANFSAYLLSKHNAVSSSDVSDMTRPLNEYFISSSHNTYLVGRQVGDESSIEPYIRALQKGCRCIEIDIWSNSDDMPEVRHGHAFTSSIPLAAVLKVIEKYAFISSPWPLIISLEIRCNAKVQAIVSSMLIELLGDALVRVSDGLLPSPADMRHKILLKVKSTQARLTSLVSQRIGSSSPDVETEAAVDDSEVSISAVDSDTSDRFEHPSRSSSASSQSSSYSSVSSTYRALTRPYTVIDELTALAPYLKGRKFKNFSLPESKVYNHIFSVSERTVKQFSKDNAMQLKKHNTKFMMRVYPSQARLMSSNFLPHQYWVHGVQMVALNWQTYDLGMQINDAFFSAEAHAASSSGYILKPPSMRSWTKGQEKPKFRPTNWTINVISGTQLTKGNHNTTNISPFVELEIIRSSNKSERENKFKTHVVESNGFNPRFDSPFKFVLYEDDDPLFSFIRFTVKDASTGDILGLSTHSLSRLQRGYRPVHLYDITGERYSSSALFVKITWTAES